MDVLKTNLMPTRPPYLLVFVIGTLLSLLYLKLIPHVHNYSHAGKEFYVGAKLLTFGKNPYDSQQLQDASRRYAPEGWVAGKKEQPQIHLPATLAVIGLFSWLPWAVFWVIQVVLNAFCVPAIVYLCLRYLYPRPPAGGLWAGSLVMAFLAPTWQNVVIGQVALPLTLCFLLLARSTTRQTLAKVASLSFLALLKFTFSLPLLAYLFWKGTRQQRLAITLAGAAFLAVNVAAVLHIGPHAFLSGYQQQVGYSFAPGGLNDPLGPGRSARVDLAIVLAGLAGGRALDLLTRALQGILVGLFLLRVVQGGCLRHHHLSLTEVSALALLTLILFYHRIYDTVLLAPGLCLIGLDWKRRRLRPAHWALGGALILCLASIGNHNLVDLALRPLGMTQPPSLRALTVLVGYLVLVVTVFDGDEHRRADPQPDRAEAEAVTP